MNGKTLIIAEAGVNHNGSIETAKKLCLAAKNAGADVRQMIIWNPWHGCHKVSEGDL